MRRKEWKRIREQRRKCMKREFEIFCEEMGEKRGFKHYTFGNTENVAFVKFINVELLDSKKVRDEKVKRLKREIEVFCRGDGSRRDYKYDTFRISENILHVYFINQDLLDWMKCKYANMRCGVIKLRNGVVRSFVVTKRLAVKFGKGVKMSARKSKKAVKKMNSLRKKMLAKLK